METSLHASRRHFLSNGTLWLAGSSLGLGQESATPVTPLVRIGLVTDLHYADKEAKGTRHYRETLAKLEEAGEFFASHQPDFVVELGDLIDAADSVQTELAYLRRIQAAFSSVAKVRHHVLGNHCVDTLTKTEFLGEVGQEQSYYPKKENGRVRRAPLIEAFDVAKE